MKKQLAKNKQMKRAKLDKDLSNVNEGFEEDPVFDHKINYQLVFSTYYKLD